MHLHWYQKTHKMASIIASGAVAASTMHLMKNHPARMAKKSFFCWHFYYNFHILNIAELGEHGEQAEYQHAKDDENADRRPGDSDFFLMFLHDQRITHAGLLFKRLSED